MGKYFSKVETLEELRRQYRDLLKKYHPDNANGSTEATQEINAEYDKLFKILKDRHESKSADVNQGSKSNTKSAYNANMYDWENDKALREILQKIISFDGIEIEIIGQWIWISGNTYSYKQELKELGFKWASQKKQWFWHGEDFRKKSHKTKELLRQYKGKYNAHGTIGSIESEKIGCS